MGFFQKLKDFGSKVVRGVRKGVDFVRDKVAPIINKIAPAAKFAGTIAAGVSGHPEMIPKIHRTIDTVDSVARAVRRPVAPPIE